MATHEVKIRGFNFEGRVFVSVQTSEYILLSAHM